PYAMAAVGAYVADTEAEAARLFTSLQQSFVALRRGEPIQLPPPVESMEGHWTAVERAGVEHAFRQAIVGSADSAQQKIEAFLHRTRVDELMFSTAIHDHAARLHSFELLAQIREANNPVPANDANDRE